MTENSYLDFVITRARIARDRSLFLAVQNDQSGRLLPWLIAGEKAIKIARINISKSNQNHKGDCREIARIASDLHRIKIAKINQGEINQGNIYMN